jgi:hypothetical protein
VRRARRHQRPLAVAAFALLVLLCEVAGRSLAARIDVGRHIAAPSYAGADWYPFFLAGVKAGIALLLARLAWRFVRARATVRAAHGLISSMGAGHGAGTPRVSLRLSPRLWAGTFGSASVLHLSLSAGPVGLFDPLLHSSALPVFAVLSVLVALLWGAVAGWLSDYESYADAAAARALRLARPLRAPVARRPHEADATTPRRLYGLAFSVRPPPVPA